MNKYFKSITVLFSICLVVSLLLALINYITAPVIEQTKLKAETASLTEVLPDATEFEKIELNDSVPETVNAIYKDKNGAGYAITLATITQYSSSDMLISVGIDNDGIIKGVALTAYTESKDIGADYPGKFVGKDSSLEGIDIVAGVTYSSTAFKDAIKDAFTGLEAVKDKEAK